MIRVSSVEIQSVMENILLARGCPREHATRVAFEVMRNSLEGTYSHGVNRFPRLVRGIDKGFVKMDALPVLIHAFGATENYDGQLGFGIINAQACMGRAIALASEHGIGFVALRNTNHWLRAATYGYQACDQGMAGICFTNTLPNMPTWGARDARIGNNPLVMAFPWKEGHILVDMAMSQFSYGALELAVLEEKQMSYIAGFDSDGNLTTDPAAVLQSKRILPTGYWKGAALAFALDIFAGATSLGSTSSEIGKNRSDEYGLSQAFIAIDFTRIAPREDVECIVRNAVEDLLASVPDGSDQKIVYAGQRMKEIKAHNERNGIPLDERVWNEIKSM